MVLIVGDMMKNVKNSVSPMSTWFGGAVWVFSAFLVKCITMIILVKLVIRIMRIGAIAIKVRVISILSAPFNSPFPLSYVTVTVFAILSSLSSSVSSDAPGSFIFVLSSVVSVS